MKLIYKLNVIPLLSSLIIAGILVVSITNSGKSSASLLEVEKGYLPSIIKNRQINMDLAVLKKTFTDATLFGDEELLLKARELKRRISLNLDSLAFNSVNKKRELKKMSEVLETYAGLAEPLTRDMIAEKEMDDEFLAKTQKMNKAYENLGGKINSEYKALNKNASASFMKSKVLIQRIVVLLVILAIFSITSFAMGLIFSRKVITIINKMVNRLKDIAEGEGDLTQRLNISTKDETGELAEWFNTFVVKIQEIIKNISNEAKTLTQSTVNLGDVSEAMNCSANEMALKTENTAASAEQVRNNMDTVSAAVEESNTNLNTVSSAAEEMNATINEIAKNTESAKLSTRNVITKVESSVANVNDFGKRANEIVKIIDTINDISDQINLLALNATIEAASAGEAGRGFTVVAAEVKALAKQSAVAANNISDMINNIIGSVEITIQDINDINGSMAEINDVVTTIASAIEEQSITTTEITNNIAHTANGLNEVTENIADATKAVKSVANDTNISLSSSKEVEHGSQTMKLSTSQLKEMAGRLNSMVGTFTI